MDWSAILSQVQPILQEVQADRDKALRRLAKQFDQTELGDLQVDKSLLKAAESKIAPELKEAIDVAYANIHAFHKAQLRPVSKIETMPGVNCWRKAVPIQSVGLYVPGGTAPLFSTVLMLGIPAMLAGCPNICLCTPARNNEPIHPALLYAAHKVGIEQLFQIGGAQAIAAMTFGTETVPKVDKLFGPGNQYVTAAKQLAQDYKVAIDMPAGPSEVAIWADATSTPAFVAADLLSQAEHGPDSQVLLVSTDRQLIDLVKMEVERQVKELPREDMARKSLANSLLVCFDAKEEALAFVDAYAAEHLIIATDTAAEDAERITQAGSIFIGQWTPESAGDYASGTNHTLPTDGYARMYSGVSLDSFYKMITYQEISEEGLQHLGPYVEVMAEAEGLRGHKNAVTLRLKALQAPTES